MEQYARTSYSLAEKLTKDYSTSFSMSSTLFHRSIRHHIFAIYGLVRVADEIVDSYKGADAGTLLDTLEAHVYEQLASKQSFSPNPIVHAFVLTAKLFDITPTLIRPFFASMRTDLTTKSFTKKAYDQYIFGSAEVIGLMCLKVFTLGNKEQYASLETGARALGSAYQKVNFLRDLKADYDERGRVYFPGVQYETFDDAQKHLIETDIKADFVVAKHTIPHLPPSARTAIRTSYDYYWELFKTIEKAPATQIKNRRLRVPTAKKLAFYVKAKVSAP